jgi:hypothetical protein
MVDLGYLPTVKALLERKKNEVNPNGMVTLKGLASPIGTPIIDAAVTRYFQTFLNDVVEGKSPNAMAIVRKHYHAVIDELMNHGATVTELVQELLDLEKITLPEQSDPPIHV